MSNANVINRTCILFNGALRHTCLACTMRLHEEKKLRLNQYLMIGDRKAAMFDLVCVPTRAVIDVLNGKHIKATKEELVR